MTITNVVLDIANQIQIGVVPTVYFPVKVNNPNFL